MFNNQFFLQRKLSLKFFKNWGNFNIFTGACSPKTQGSVSFILTTLLSDGWRGCRYQLLLAFQSFSFSSVNLKIRYNILVIICGVSTFLPFVKIFFRLFWCHVVFRTSQSIVTNSEMNNILDKYFLRVAAGRWHGELAFLSFRSLGFSLVKVTSRFFRCQGNQNLPDFYTHTHTHIWPVRNIPSKERK